MTRGSVARAIRYYLQCQKTHEKTRFKGDKDKLDVAERDLLKLCKELEARPKPETPPLFEKTEDMMPPD